MDGVVEGRTSRCIWIAGINYSSGSEGWRCWRVGVGWGWGVPFKAKRNKKRWKKNCDYSESEQAEERRAAVPMEVWH